MRIAFNTPASSSREPTTATTAAAETVQDRDSTAGAELHRGARRHTGNRNEARSRDLRTRTDRRPVTKHRQPARRLHASEPSAVGNPRRLVGPLPLRLLVAGFFQTATSDTRRQLSPVSGVCRRSRKSIEGGELWSRDGAGVSGRSRRFSHRKWAERRVVRLLRRSRRSAVAAYDVTSGERPPAASRCLPVVVVVAGL